MNNFILGTELPILLGPDWNRLFDTWRYPLLEQPIPNLCADRCDYFLRDAFSFGLIEESWVRKFLRHLTVFNGQMVLMDCSLAVEAARYYMLLNEKYYCDSRTVGLYQITANMLKHALSMKYITEHHLDRWTDRAIMDYLRKYECRDKTIETCFRRMRDDVVFLFNPPKDLSKFRLLVGDMKLKVRYIDPLVMINRHQVVLTSDLDPTLKQDIQFYIAKYQKSHQLYYKL